MSRFTPWRRKTLMREVRWHKPERPPKEGLAAQRPRDVTVTMTRINAWYILIYLDIIIFDNDKNGKTLIMLIHVDHFTGTLWLHLNFCGARQKPGAVGRFAAPFGGLADPTGLPLRIRGSLQSFQSSEMMPDTQVFQVFQIVSNRFKSFFFF